MTTDNSIDWVSAQTMLLTDCGLRDLFRQAPRRVTKLLNVRTEEISLFEALIPDQLDAQADTLVQKRFHEVGKLLPITFAALGDKARYIFELYSATYWPEGYQRHLLDAARFARHLQSLCSEDLQVFELNWIEFILSPGRFRLFPVVLRNRRGKRYAAVQILTSFRGQLKQWFTYFVIPFPTSRRVIKEPIPVAI